MRKLLNKIVKRIPSNKIRIFCYQYLYGYQIGRNVYIGKSIINCKNFIIEDNVVIRDNNIFSCNDLILKKGAVIHSNNIFRGTKKFQLGENSRIINHHYFDLYNNIIIGDNSWIAGRNSQFWTHGSLKTKLGKDLDIHIGNSVYVGSSTLVSPGTKISDINLIGLGSVVSGKFIENYCLISGNPAQIIKTSIDWRENW